MAPELGKRILVLSPHPDDEVVGCAHAIARAHAQKAEIFLAHLTTGLAQFELALPGLEGFQAENISKRQKEAKDAAAQLGAQIIWFGDLPARRIPQNIFRIFWEINALITHHQIDQIWCPAYEGGHVDHDAVSGIAAALRKSRDLSVLEFAEYHRAPNKRIGAAPIANRFMKKMNTEWIIKATPEEQKKKRALLKIYASEADNLKYFNVTHEMLRPQPDYDYTFAPHAGRPWYNQYWWVPFPHPRIDRTQPGTVCQAIVNLLAATVLPEAPQATSTPPETPAAA